MMVIGQEVEDALDRRVDLFVEADFVLGHCGFLILSDRTKTLSAPAGESADNAHGSWPDNRRCCSRGGKSGPRRARCQVTPGRREPTESATENRPHTSRTRPARVKRCGKSAPRRQEESREGNERDRT